MNSDDADALVDAITKAKKEVDEGASLIDVLDRFSVEHFTQHNVSVWKCVFEKDELACAELTRREIRETFGKMNQELELDLYPERSKSGAMLACNFLHFALEHNAGLSLQDSAECIKKYLKENYWHLPMRAAAQWYVDTREKIDSKNTKWIEEAKKIQAVVNALWSEIDEQ